MNNAPIGTDLPGFSRLSPPAQQLVTDLCAADIGVIADPEKHTVFFTNREAHTADLKRRARKHIRELMTLIVPSYKGRPRRKRATK